MADMMHHDFFRGLMQEAHDLTTTTGDQLKIALFTSSLTPDKDDTAYSVTNEVVGTGYTAGGASLVKGDYVLTDDDTNDLVKFDHTTDITWSSSTLTARYARLYNDDCVDPADALICTYDFGTDKSSSSGNFTIQFHADGCFKITG
jgi:hypothetical protein